MLILVFVQNIHLAIRIWNKNYLMNKSHSCVKLTYDRCVFDFQNGNGLKKVIPHLNNFGWKWMKKYIHNDALQTKLNCKIQYLFNKVKITVMKLTMPGYTYTYIIILH